MNEMYDGQPDFVDACMRQCLSLHLRLAISFVVSVLTHVLLHAAATAHQRRIAPNDPRSAEDLPNSLWEIGTSSMTDCGLSREDVDELLQGMFDE